MLYGVDIHAQYQAGISLPALKAQGYSFVVTKASEGLGIPSNATLTAAQFKARYLAWIRECRQIGLVPGLYHWIRAGNGAAQARFFHGLVVEAGGPRGLLIALDCEDDATYADVVAWRDEWRRLTGGHPFLLYTGGWWWRPRGWDGAAITPYLWDSHYLTADADTIADDPASFAARIPADWWSPGYGGWDGATILQFTSGGDAGSLGNNVDLDATRLTLAQLTALTGDDDMSIEDSTRIKSAEAHAWAIRNGVSPIAYINGNPDLPINVGNPLWDMLRAIAAAANVDADELAAIEAAAKRGAEAGVADAADELVAAVLAGLPDAALTRADVEAALRSVLGSLDQA